MRFAPVYFDFDQSGIRSDAAGILRDHAQILKSNPDLRVTILGFTDEVGSSKYNLELGGRRARSVFDYLKSLGIAEGQMTCRSMGRVISDGPYWQNRRCDLSAEPK
jgi:peptidoglycan-associated lipoprotein